MGSRCGLAVLSEVTYVSLLVAVGRIMDVIDGCCRLFGVLFKSWKDRLDQILCANWSCVQMLKVKLDCVSTTLKQPVSARPAGPGDEGILGTWLGRLAGRELHCFPQFAQPYWSILPRPNCSPVDKRWTAKIINRQDSIYFAGYRPWILTAAGDRFLCPAHNFSPSASTTLVSIPKKTNS